MKNLCLIACLFIFTNSRAQVNLYVDSSATASGAGTSWATAYKTLNEALNFANAASTTTQYNINVAKGTYFPTGSQAGTNRDSTFAILRGGMKLYGGYPSGGGVRDFVTNPTILSGNIGLSTDSLDNCYHVFVLSNIAATSDSAIVDGFSIVRGNANGTGTKSFNGLSFNRNYGGGIYNNGTSAKVKFANCIFMINFASTQGGAMFNNNAQPGIFNSSFIANRCPGDGGAINNSGSAVNISSCDFSANSNCALYHFGNSQLTIASSNFVNNTGNNLSGAIYQNGQGVCTITFTTFTNNVGTSAGAFSGYNLNLTGCSFTGNRSLQEGGAISCNQGTIAGTTFRGNKATISGGAIYYYGNSSSTLTVSNSVFSRDTAAFGGAFSSTNTNNPVFNNCSFYWNRADYGGAINSIGITLNGSTISGNTAAVNGGGCYIGGTLPGSYAIKSTLISGNRAVNNGGGIYSRNVATGSTLTNVTLAGDTATNGLAMYDSLSSQTILNSIIYNGLNGIFNFANSNPVITYSIVEGGYTGTGNLNIDPKFVSPLATIAAPDTTGNYNILSCSQAINSGLNSGSYTGVVDVAGFPRLFGTTVDRGAYEYQAAFTGAGTITGNSTVCANGTLQLANVTSGGVWTSTNTSLATVSSTGLVSGVAPGTDTIIYTVSGTTICSTSAIKIITILPLPTVNPITGNTSLCVGTTSPMSNTTPSGVWSSSSTSTVTINTSGVVNPLAAGNVNIIYTVTSGGCSNTATLPVVVNALPAVPPITGGTGVCVNGTLQLSNAMGGGVWSSNNNAIATVDATGLVTGVTFGIDTINYTVTSSAGCVKKVILIISVSNPPNVSAITGGSSVCANGFLQLNNTNPLGVWASSNTSLALVGTTGLVIGIAPGVDTITYSVTNSAGCTKTVLHIITVNPVPVVSPITGSNTVCINGAIQLSNATPGGVWTSTQTSLATVSSTGLVTAHLAGNVSISYTVTDANNCSNVTTHIIGITPVLVSVTKAGVVLTADQAGATYQWIDCVNGFQAIAGQTSQSFTPAFNGLYGVVVTYNGCTDTSACVAITELGIDAPNTAEAYELYPNPTSGVITIKANLRADLDLIEVFDMTGRLMNSFVPAGRVTRIDLSAYPKGLYVIELRGRAARTQAKVKVE